MTRGNKPVHLPLSLLHFVFLECRYKIALLLQYPGKSTKMRMRITLILFPSTRMVKHTSPVTTSASICGTSISAIKASVSIKKYDSFPLTFSRVDIVDIKPVNMEELTEVITAAEFHPLHCNNFMYSSSKGTIKLADMRDSALCDRHAKRTSVQPVTDAPLLNSCAQNSRKKRIPQTAPSSLRSLHPYRTLNSAATADTSYRVTTCPLKYGI